MLKSKTCKSCEVTKEVTEFYKRKNSYNSKCKKCFISISKEYNKNHKEKANESIRKWQQSNKEKVAKQTKKYYESFKLDHYIVYYLPEVNYCGVTNNTNYRMKLHKSHGNNTNNWRVLATTKTRQEALTIENKYHTELGMNGASGWKKAIKITNQLRDEKDNINNKTKQI